MIPRCAVGLAVVLAALAFRVGPALRGYQPSPDAAEYTLLARSLAAGEGYTLPIRVRDLDGGPAAHPAWAERAPLWPALLALPVAAGVGASGWPDPRLQLVNVGLAALAALLASALAGRLAARGGLEQAAGLRAALAAGLLVGWSAFLTRASIHLWAEPLGLVLVLAGLLAWTWAERAGSDAQPADDELQASEPDDELPARVAPVGLGAALVVGLCAGLARFARPEAWVLVPLLLALGWRRLDRRAWCALAGALVAVNAIGIAISGVLAPQLFLLRVTHFEVASQAGAALETPSWGAILGGALRNLAGQLEWLLLPKYGCGALVLPLAALAWRRRPTRAPLLVGLALLLATAAVWSTHDPSRFTIAPYGIWACVAAVEAERRCAAWWPGRRAPRVIYGVALVGVMAYAGTRELRRDPPPGPPALSAQPGEPALDDPWSYALLTGRPARLRSR